MRTERKFRINDLTLKPADEQNDYEQYELKIQTPTGEMKAYVAKGQWNANWEVGQTVTADVETKVSGSGNKYAKLYCPAEQRKFPAGGGRPQGNSDTSALLKQILEELKKLNQNFSQADQPDSSDTPDTPGDDGW
jgi:hypothetical protein